MYVWDVGSGEWGFTPNSAERFRNSRFSAVSANNMKHALWWNLAGFIVFWRLVHAQVSTGIHKIRLVFIMDYHAAKT